MLQWAVESPATGGTVIKFDGEITGQIDFAALSKQRGKLVLDLAQVRRINSIGAQSFTRFLEVIASNAPVDVVNCPVTVIAHLNILPALADRLNIRSLFVPFECPKCLAEAEHLVELAAPGRLPVLPKIPCTHCGTALELSDLEERYFAFLRR